MKTNYCNWKTERELSWGSSFVYVQTFIIGFFSVCVCVRVFLSNVVLVDLEEHSKKSCGFLLRSVINYSYISKNIVCIIFLFNKTYHKIEMSFSLPTGIYTIRMFFLIPRKRLHRTKVAKPQIHWFEGWRLMLVVIIHWIFAPPKFIRKSVSMMNDLSSTPM